MFSSILASTHEMPGTLPGGQTTKIPRHCPVSPWISPLWRLKPDCPYFIMCAFYIKNGNFFFCFLKDSGGSKALSLGCLACTQRDLKMANVTPNYHSLEGRRLPLGLPESSTVKVLHLWSLLRAFLITWCISPWLHDLELLREVWTPGSDKITLKCK